MSTTDGKSVDGIAVPTVALITDEVVRPVLDIASIEPDDNFFDLDASSLHLVQIVGRAEYLFGVEVPLFELFDEPTVAGLLRIITDQLDAR
jgi:acyl carrier protein